MEKYFKKFEEKLGKITKRSLKNKKGELSFLKFMIYLFIIIIFSPLFLLYFILKYIICWLIILDDSEEIQEEKAEN